MSNTQQPEALRLADQLERMSLSTKWDKEAAAELRRLHDLLGKANALCRIRAEEIKALKARAPIIEATGGAA